MTDLPREAVEPRVRHVALWFCEPCIRGEGEECHTPGCALYLHRVDLPISLIEYLDDRAATPAPEPPAAEPGSDEFDDEDMAAVGRALMDALKLHESHPAIIEWHPAQCPSEIVGDLLSKLDAERAIAGASWNAAIETAARCIEGGSFLHPEAPPAKWAREAAPAIRKLKKEARP